MSSPVLSNVRQRLIVFARWPEPGKVKTRLLPALTAEAAAALHRRLLMRTWRTAIQFTTAHGAELELRHAGGTEADWQHWLGGDFRLRPQAEGDLGARMAGALADASAEGSRATVIIGSDCPQLTPTALAQAFGALAASEVVLGPAEDGGYYLIGLTHPRPNLFAGIKWGTDRVLAQTLEAVSRDGITSAQLDTLADIDRPDDLAGWREIESAEDLGKPRISVIIPALNEAGQLRETLRAARAGEAYEIIVVDGGSTDGTAELAKDEGALVLASPPSRAGQMNAGALRASGSVLLFLHADTRLPDLWPRAIAGALSGPGVAAGAFGFRTDTAFTGSRWVEWTTNLRSRRQQLPYGDQGLFLRRAVFEELGGFARMPIMEDYEFVRRLRRRGRIVTTDSTVSTSARRWQRLGVLRVTAINQLMVAGYHLGVSLERLARLYRGP